MPRVFGVNYAGESVLTQGEGGVILRICGKCRKAKPPEDYYPDRGRSMRTRYNCRDCINEESREFARLHPERRKRYKLASRVRSFGLEPDEYEALRKKQKHRCGICGRRPKKGEPALHIDHDHVTGRVRGLLCSTCNPRLEWFEKHAAAAAAYLVDPPARSILKRRRKPPQQRRGRRCA